MMLIVEGPDGGGKTSLIQALRWQLQFYVMPRPCTSENGVDPTTLRAWVDRDLGIMEPDELRVYDRHPLISDPIYGPIVRGSMSDGFNDLSWLRGAMLKLEEQDPLIVYCLPPRDVAMANLRRDHKPTTGHLEAVLRCGEAIYDLYCARSALDALVFKTFVWDYTGDKTENLIELIERIRDR